MKKILIALLILVLAASALVVANGARLKRFAYEGFGRRDDWQQPGVVVASLGVRAGEHVADIGAGGGYSTFRLADAVGAVYAVDVDEEMTDYLEDRVAQEVRTNVEVILGQYDDRCCPTAGSTSSSSPTPTTISRIRRAISRGCAPISVAEDA